MEMRVFQQKDIITTRIPSFESFIWNEQFHDKDNRHNIREPTTWQQVAYNAVF